MRIGIVRFLNARPLDYAIRRLSLAGSTIHLASSESPQRIEIIEEDPSRLCDLLLQGKLDCALISSVECLRNPTQIGWCQTVGICTHKRSHSILYIRRNPTTISQRDFPSSFPTSFPKEASVSKMYYDRASRSSVALWKCLYLQSHENLPESEEIPSSEIPRLLRQEGVGGILIGDPALQFLEDLKSTKRKGEKWIVTDLGEWWYEKEGLPFVFALWAYPLNRPIHDSFFEDSLQEGLEHISDILQQNRDSFHDSKHYLTEILHYRLGKEEKLSLKHFSKYLKKYGLDIGRVGQKNRIDGG